MPTRFAHYPQRPQNRLLINSFSILCNAHEAASSFLGTFLDARASRAVRGTLTDKEQDLLRAMLIFSASGLDSMVKQMIYDTLQEVINADQGATVMFKSYIERRIKRGDELDYKFLAGVIAESDPRTLMISDLIESLRSSSLQSKEQLLKVASFFNIPSRQLSTNLTLLDDIFGARNQIAHEMDIDFTQPNRRRRPRSKTKMVAFTNEVFKLADSFLRQVDNKLEHHLGAM